MSVLFTQEKVTEIALNEAKREGKAEGRLGVFYELVRDNLLSLCTAADKAGQSEEEFTSGMEAYFAKANEPKEPAQEGIPVDSEAQFINTEQAAEAITATIESCKSKGILQDYLEANENRVMRILMTELEQMQLFEAAFNEARREGKAEGRLGVFYELVRDNLLSLCTAADKAGESEEEFTSGMEAYFAKGNIVNR